MCQQPALSVIVVTYNMQREAARTLHTLSSLYQTGVASSDYEVVVVDNGSADPPDPDFVASFGANFRLIFAEAVSRSPVAAINLGVRRSRGRAVAIMVDGARMLSPGILRWTLFALRSFGRVVVTVPGWRLGPDVHNRSIVAGYDRNVEDALLSTRDWKTDGYLLFDLCEQLDPGCEEAGWFSAVSESNFICCDRGVYDAIGGFDERFTSTGGGLCSHDFFRRVIDDGRCEVVSLVGEGTFHQIHGGVSTNVAEADHPIAGYAAEYLAIRATPLAAPVYEPILVGTVSTPARHLMQRCPSFQRDTRPVSARGNVRWLQRLTRRRDR